MKNWSQKLIAGFVGRILALPRSAAVSKTSRRNVILLGAWNDPKTLGFPKPCGWSRTTQPRSLSFAFLIATVLVLALLCGCVSKQESARKVQQAYLAGQRDALAKQNKTDSVWVVGNVWNPIIPWTEDLTLARAIVAAAYRGSRDPSEIVLRREGQPAFHVTAAQLLKGVDFPLNAGDRIEVRQ